MQQKVIEPAYYEGLPQTEMAERIGEPPGCGAPLTPRSWSRHCG
jgi:hypothetical protein